MDSPAEQFRAALAAAGVILAADARIVADGQLHRAKTQGDKPGQLSGWYRLHLDEPIAGVGGDWRQGIKVNWCAKRQNALTASERAEIARRIAEDRKRAQGGLEARHRAAAQRAAHIWANSKPADAGHQYLRRKGIGAGIARESRGSLVLPVVGFDGALHGLQFIDEQGQKRFLPGTAKQAHFIPTGGLPDGSRSLWICEGHATASTIQAMRPSVCAIAACDAGNLKAVATEARRRWPALELTICPDFDAVGRQKGREAAEAARARILPPPAEIPEGVTDWNDWAALRREVAHG
jgi:putative DNA primase/helicase